MSQGDGVVVAVVDSGVNPNHQDLVGQVVPGADFSGEKTDGRVDTDGHGTGMASLIAGHGHGPGADSGVMGLAPKAKILPIRLNWSEDAPAQQSSDIGQAIRFAVDHGAKVISMSIGGYSRLDSQARAAISYAVSKDVVLVASTGNGGGVQSAPVEYPAAFPGVVAVGAVDSEGFMWEKSTAGPETTIAAPGVGIYTASGKSNTSYGVGKGTSGAAAHVSATAALIRAKYPSLSAGQVINRMIKSATPPPDASSVPNNRYGYGILAPAKALEANPAVDNGPRENPLVARAESQGPPPASEPTAEPGDGASGYPPAPGAATGENRGITYTLYGMAALVGLVLVVLVVILVVLRRRRRRRAEVPPAPVYGYAPPPQGPPYH
ncbi:S8 family serine peptidase [Kitasatospora sp. NPDC004240]